jgi:hypothetical protein
VKQTRAKPRIISHCLNCNEELKGKYCYKCGQKGTEIDVPLRELIREFLKDELKIDTRLNRTVVPLLFKPGLLTADYIAGRRVRYVPPLRMYVFVSLVMFFLLALGSRHLNLKTMVAGDEKGIDSIETVDEVARDTKGFFGRFGLAVRHGWQKARQEPERMLELAVEKFAHIMFLLLPIFALLLKLLYIRRNLCFMKHMVFALHFHAFMFVVISVILALSFWGGAFCKNQAHHLFWLVPLYLLLAMKRFYRQGLIKTALKLILLAFNYVVIFSIGVALAFIFSLMSL